MAKIGLLGHGIVGSGVAELLERNRELVATRAGEPMILKYILDKNDPPSVPYGALFVKDVSVILDDPEVTLVAEAIGGVEFAYHCAVESLKRGKHFVTSNKELVAEKGAELLALAKEHQVRFLFEASVGGGIPIVRPLVQCLAANRIVGISGILNGTSNFILTKMVQDGMAFEEALAQAQELGYAEADPSADVDGLDSCRKICILAALAFGQQIAPQLVETQGIRQVTLEAVQLAKTAGCAVKLVARAKSLADGQLGMVVAPMVIPYERMLAHVEDVYNAVELVGDAVDNVVLYGKGAGKFPTASALVADLMDCVENPSKAALSWTKTEEGDSSLRTYRQLALPHAVWVEGTLESAQKAFGEIRPLEAPPGLVAFVTRPLTPGKFAEGLILLAQQGKVRSNLLFLEGK